MLTRQYDPFSYDVSAQMLEDILIVGRATPKNIDQLDKVFKGLYKRMNEYEVRVGKLGDVRGTTLPSMIMITATRRPRPTSGRRVALATSTE